MIHRLDNGSYVISSGGVWLPGSYADERAARLAFRLGDGTLSKLQETVNEREPDHSKRVITYDEVLRAYRERKPIYEQRQ